MKALSMVGMLACAGWLAGCAVDEPGSEDSSDVASDVVVVPNAVGPCASGHVCLYQNGQQTGASISVTSSISIRNLATISCAACQNGQNGGNGTFDNQMSSWQNASDVDYCWFPDASFGGASHLMKAHSKNTVPAEYNDHASSLKSGGC
jgi:hypothetical protein